MERHGESTHRLYLQHRDRLEQHCTGPSGAYRVHVFSGVVHAEPAGHVQGMERKREGMSAEAFPFLDEFDPGATQIADTILALVL